MTLRQAKRSFTYFDPFTKRQEQVRAGFTWADPASIAFQADPTAFDGSSARSIVTSRRAGAGSSPLPVPARREYSVCFWSRGVYEDLMQELESPDMDGERACWLYGVQDGDRLVVNDFLPEAHGIVDRGPRHVGADPVRALRHGGASPLFGHGHSHPGGRSRPSDEDRDAWGAWLDLCRGSVFASLIVAHEGRSRPGPHAFVTRRRQGEAVTARAELVIPLRGA